MKPLRQLIVLALLVIAPSAMAQGQKLEKITLLHSQPQITAAFAYSSSLPVYLGYFKEEGLEVEVNPMAGAAAAMQLVVGGRADFAIGNPSGAMIAIQKGADVKFYYTSIRGDIFGVALPAETGMKTLTDLKGKTVGVSSFASGGTNYVKGLMKTLGLESGKDYNLVEVGVGARAAGAFRSKQIDAFSLWDEAYVTLQQNGIPFSNIIRDPRAVGHAVGSIVAKTADYSKRRKTLIGVGRAIAKAQLFQYTNPEAAIRIHWKVYPQTAPRDGITDAAIKRELNVLAVRTKLISKNAMNTNRWGDVPREVMEKFQAYLVETEVLPKAVNVDNYYTNDFIDEINKFDEGAIVKQARGFKL
ncbi:MAG TPA: ABC transporter substrate-binding protein [Burkholderiales bacterium]|nr:ABC transporter substrate-binding protein [Burkholderiales bacterium]